MPVPPPAGPFCARRLAFADWGVCGLATVGLPSLLAVLVVCGGWWLPAAGLTADAADATGVSAAAAADVGQQVASGADGQRVYQQRILPLLRQHCWDCHATAVSEGELDLERFAGLSEVKQDVLVWAQVVDQVRLGEMPPRDVSQLTEAERDELVEWARRVIDQVALENAGDPGPISLRRLSNWEYTYSIRDLTGVPTLTPAADFPLDGAAGEGFTNAAAALVMSPTLLNRYLDAAKQVAEHAVLVPSGIAFSPSTSSSDWALERMAAIRELYARYSSDEAGTPINLQGVVFEVNGRGHLPVADYVNALNAAKQPLQRGETTIQSVAQQHGVSGRYLDQLYQTLQTPPGGDDAGVVIDQLRRAWQQSQLAPESIQAWQQALWRFASVGHIGKVNGPQRWQEAVNPLATDHSFRLPLQAAPGQSTITVDLIARSAGPQPAGDVLLWSSPRLVDAAGREVPVNEVGGRWRRMVALRQHALQHTVQYLQVAAAALETGGPADWEALLADSPELDRRLLVSWLDLLGISVSGPAVLGDRIGRQLERAGGRDAINGWAGDHALSVLSNSSASELSIPGRVRGGGVVAHPSPSRAVVLAWQSPMAGQVTVTGQLSDADTNCGNGFEWALQLRRGSRIESLGSGRSQGAEPIELRVPRPIAVHPGDAIAVVIAPGGADHACDCTAVDLTVHEVSAAEAVDGPSVLTWDLASDVASDILAGNPHADQHGNPEVWWFNSEPTTAHLAAIDTIPAGSLLARWKAAEDQPTRRALAEQIADLLAGEATDLPADSPDGQLRTRLRSFHGDLFADVDFGSDVGVGADSAAAGGNAAGGNAADAASADLTVGGNSRWSVRLPAEWADGMQLVTTASLLGQQRPHAAVQVAVVQGTEQPGAAAAAAAEGGAVGLAAAGEAQAVPFGQWIESGAAAAGDSAPAGDWALQPGAPLLADADQAAGQQLVAALDRFRKLFPIALCYPDIVPIDEVVTLRLYYREDDHLQRLMLDEAETAELDRLWEELLTISRAPLKQVDAYEQLYQYATQDADPSAFAPLREPIHQAAERFQQQLLEMQPEHIRAVIELAQRAWRRPLSDAQRQELRDLYEQLRGQELDHEAAIRLMLVRVFVAPAFLYRGEQPQPGPHATTIDSYELATRLSYFLWSSTPDDQLAAVASSGQLADSEVLHQQVRRMMADPRARRWALEFGCQWLMVRDVAVLDEKSDRHFPTFLELRGDMQEEVVRFLTDLIANDRSVLSLLDADHTFLTPALADHYGQPLDAPQLIDSETLGGQSLGGEAWQRVDRWQSAGRGGILGFAATLAKQSGASRTSPILRGMWLSEVLLGERIPPPPKDIPQLPDEIPEGLTERQLTELHSSAAACATCHLRVDPWGFALEGFDAIGRARTVDAAGVPIDSVTQLPDGTPLDSLDSVRQYLLTVRRDDFLRQFCRKLLGFALGRSVQLSDKPLIDEMMTQLAAHDYRLSVAIDCIVTSDQFQRVRGRDQTLLAIEGESHVP